MTDTDRLRQIVAELDADCDRMLNDQPYAPAVMRLNRFLREVTEYLVGEPVEMQEPTE